MRVIIRFPPPCHTLWLPRAAARGVCVCVRAIVQATQRATLYMFASSTAARSHTAKRLPFVQSTQERASAQADRHRVIPLVCRVVSETFFPFEAGGVADVYKVAFPTTWVTDDSNCTWSLRARDMLVSRV